jgi:hypothetical protein
MAIFGPGLHASGCQQLHGTCVHWRRDACAAWLCAKHMVHPDIVSKTACPTDLLKRPAREQRPLNARY